jgi:hypothetical protein
MYRRETKSRMIDLNAENWLGELLPQVVALAR